MENFKSKEHNKSERCKVENGKLGLRLQDCKSEDYKTVKVVLSCSSQSRSLNANNFQLSKVAFTLAEVLITLGIIGVVAAITMPPLIKNYQKHTYVEGLKVAYSMLSQGIQKAMADDGVTNFKDTELYKAAEWKNYQGYTAKKNSMFVPLNKYFKVIDILSREELTADGVTSGTIEDTQACKKLVKKYNCGWYLNSKNKCFCSRDINVFFANGMTGNLVFYDYGYYLGYIHIDINGRKGPNIIGRDLFEMEIYNDGRVLPCGSKAAYQEMAKYQNKDFETLLSERHWSKIDACSNTTTLNGYRCTSRIIEENWKMNY